MSDKTWDSDFTPSYTPIEMIEQGVFEGIYTDCIKDISSKYKKSKKVLKCGSKPDININRYGVKSRQSLKEWEKNGWVTKDSPLGWWEWYIKYFEGRRIEEDEWQIKRWRSFVARHQAQVSSKCKNGDASCNTKQRQGLLQWAWNSDTPFTSEQQEKNLKRILSITGAKLKISQESYVEKLIW